MFKSATVLTGILLSGMLALSAQAEDQQPAAQRMQPIAGAPSKVSKTQKALIEKREQAKKQRDKKLKIRAANVQETGGQTVLPPLK